MKTTYKIVQQVFLGMILVVTLVSCKKFLDIKPDTSLTTGNAYNSAQDIENAITGAYRAFYHEYYIWDNVLLSDVRSDNAYAGGGGDQPILAYDELNISTGNNRMLADWSQLYIGIGRCNAILNKIDAISDPFLDKNNRRTQIKGEAAFLRAFHYYQLVKQWGGVPLELNSNSSDPAKTNLPRATEKEVYDQIVKDLELAVTNLPDAYNGPSGSVTDNIPSVNKVRATKGAANALLAKVWAQRSDRDYNKVLQYCNAVIGSPAGYSLLTNYDHLFDGDHYSNSESILEVAFIGGNWDVSNWGVQLYLAPEDGWQKYCVPSKNLVNAYDAEGDNVRKNANITYFKDVPWADENWNPCQDNAVAVPFNFKQRHPDGWNSGDRYYLLRLADIILLKAEAQNETGNFVQAATTLNIVRNRVGLAPVTGTSQTQMKTKILNERRLELAFEAQRWDDLLRSGQAVNIMNNLGEVKYTCAGGTPSAPVAISYNCNQNKLLLPIPQGERDANPNLTQNPGY